MKKIFAKALVTFALFGGMLVTLLIRVLHSLSGIMAISKTTLKDTVLMLIKPNIIKIYLFHSYYQAKYYFLLIILVVV